MSEVVEPSTEEVKPARAKKQSGSTTNVQAKVDLFDQGAGVWIRAGETVPTTAWMELNVEAGLAEYV